MFSQLGIGKSSSWKGIYGFLDTMYTYKAVRIFAAWAINQFWQVIFA